VTHLRVFNIERVIVYLKSPTEFGDEIKFVPHTEFRLWKEHSVVGELKALVKTYNEKGTFNQMAQANNSFNQTPR
jgi:hypothetical protein